MQQTIPSLPGADESAQRVFLFLLTLTFDKNRTLRSLRTAALQ